MFELVARKRHNTGDKKIICKKAKLSSTTTINLFFRAIYIVVRYTHSFFEDIHPSSSEIFLKEKKKVTYYGQQITEDEPNYKCIIETQKREAS